MSAPAAIDYRSLWTTYLHHVPHRLSFIDAGGIRTRCLQAGDPQAPPLVMVHGTAGSLENYAANIGPLSAHYHCVAFDCVGSGLTDKPDHAYEIPLYVRHLADTMDALGLPHAALMGNSLGGWICGAFARAYPERVSRLILVSSSGLLIDPANSARIQAMRTAAVDDPSWATMERMFEGLIASPAHRMPDLLGMRQVLYRQPGMRAAMRHILAIQDAGTRERNIIPEDDWRALQPPTLVVIGGREKAYYIETGRRLAALIPRCTLLELADAGHWSMLEAAEAFNEAVLAFLSK